MSGRRLASVNIEDFRFLRNLNLKFCKPNKEISFFKYLPGKWFVMYAVLLCIVELPNPPRRGKSDGAVAQAAALAVSGYIFFIFFPMIHVVPPKLI
jgi:hypothetical protein